MILQNSHCIPQRFPDLKTLMAEPCISSSLVKSSVPSPVTGSHPLTVLKPLVPQPGLPPVVIWFWSAGENCTRENETYVIEGIGVLVDGRVKEPHGALVGAKTLLVDQSDDTREDWGRGADAACE